MSSKAGSKAKENIESVESLLRKTFAKDGLLSLTRAAENPIQWIHLLDTFDPLDSQINSKGTAAREGFAADSPSGNSHNSGQKLMNLKSVFALAQVAAKASGESRPAGSMDLSGWPLTPYPKVQVFKCEKCCMEFCSPVNHRRHLRMVHRRAAHPEKDLRSLRQQLATVWDSFNSHEAYEVIDVKKLKMEDLEGVKVARALSHLLQQRSVIALPHSYVKSGAMLLDLVQGGVSKKLPTSSELFKILDGTSEKTFPSFGLNAMQRYVFEGGAGKVGLEPKNLVSSLGFLVELNLVKAFIKEKDEEAKRFQTALVEEEEASRKKQAQILERKRMKKARQKDSKERDSKPSDAGTGNLAALSDSSEDEDRCNFSPVVKCIDQSRPSSNAFENLYHRLAGEASDSDNHEETVSTMTVVGLSNDSRPSSPKAIKDDEPSHTEDVGLDVSDTSPVSLIHDDVKTACDVGRLGSEHEVSHYYGNGTPNAFRGGRLSGVKKPYITEKGRYPNDRFSRGRESVFLHHKNFSKDRSHVNPKNIAGQHVLNDSKESDDILCAEASSSRSRQFSGKPIQHRKYYAGMQANAGVWTKKGLKCSDTTTSDVITNPLDSESSPKGVPGSNVSNFEFLSSPSISAEEPSTTGNLADKDSCSPPKDNDSSVEQLNLTIMGSEYDNQNAHAAGMLSPDIEHHSETEQVGDTSANASPVIVGSVVIGSVRVSLVDPELSLNAGGLMSEKHEDGLQGVLTQPSHVESSGPVNSSQKLELCRALHENGTLNSVATKDVERILKSAKLLSKIDSEEKENHEHASHLAREEKLSRLTVTQGANFKAGHSKVWRPVASSTFHGSQDVLDRIGAVKDAVKAASQNRATDKETSISTVKDVESAEVYEKDEVKGVIDSRGCTVHVTKSLGSIASSTYEAAVAFLSERWSEAVMSPDTAVLSIEDEEEDLKQSEQQGDLDIKASAEPMTQSSKTSFTDSGDNKVTSASWKHGCHGSAMGAHRRLNGKNPGLHNAPRLAGYRYVPK
ncbi:hypothetical protein KP509_14G013900 [Ceratopteris richardii]|uniref:C2H2-type domain-containing protein n=1 Tax=Ceratopteris richardii TaxID=49495 RepID=A0A8T2T9P4_CERRI|nr:hypothetical protein KP509_14G013900 [Ceratopteris richardii]